MDKKVYTTIIAETKNEYILGRISGIIRAFSSEESEYPVEVLSKEIFHIGDLIISKPYGHQIKVLATSEEYEKIKVAISKCYPGRCDFDTTMNG